MTIAVIHIDRKNKKVIAGSDSGCTAGNKKLKTNIPKFGVAPLDLGNDAYSALLAHTGSAGIGTYNHERIIKIPDNTPYDLRDIDIVDYIRKSIFENADSDEHSVVCVFNDNMYVFFKNTPPFATGDTYCIGAGSDFAFGYLEAVKQTKGSIDTDTIKDCIFHTCHNMLFCEIPAFVTEYELSEFSWNDNKQSPTE